MIDLDSYSRQVFNYVDPIFLFMSVFESTADLKFAKNCSMFPVAFVAGSLQGH